VIRVVAPSESEMKSKKDALDDAISSTKAAVAEGIVPGGGRMLNGTGNIGFDAARKQYVDLYEAGIYRPCQGCAHCARELGFGRQRSSAYRCHNDRKAV
jgi:hypothetical protein